MELLPIVVLVVVFAVPYFIPSIVAHIRVKQNLPVIFAMNLLLGWTPVGWIVALVWALTREAPESDPRGDDNTTIQLFSVQSRSCER